MYADLLLTHARIYTLDDSQPRAAALAIGGEHILALSDGESPPIPAGRRYNLGGRCVLPGLTDSHIHFAWYALGRRELDLSGVGSLAEMAARVAGRARATRPGDWILGRGWDQERWPERRFPTAADLDAVAPEHPVLLRAKSGHALVVNSRTLQLANITAETPDPAGGRIGRDEQGRPNGMFFEDSAMEQVAQVAPQPGVEETAAAMREAFPQAWRVGLTSIHDMDGGPAFAAYQALRARGELGLRVTKYLPVEALHCALELGIRAGFGDGWLRVEGIKLFADGALGPRTAAMLAPYEGESGVGILTITADELRCLTRAAATGGLGLAIHAIGDRANRMTLDALADAGGGGGLSTRRRIEHVQLIHPADIPRLAALGVTASMQPLHATQDYEMADRYWGDRAAFAYAWRSLLDAGARLAFGSDCPVEDLNPFVGIHAAVTRRRRDGLPGPQGWYPTQRLTVAEAAHAYTLGAAQAVGLDDRLGSLSPGKLADLVVLDRDIFTCDPSELAETQVVATMIGGKWVHEGW